MNPGRTILYGLSFVVVLLSPVWGAESQTRPASPWPEPIQLVLDVAKPLQHPRGNRLPLYLWPAMNPGAMSDAQAEQLVRELDARGVGLVCRWDPGDRDKSLREALPVARAQKKLGQRVNIDATNCLHAFFNGDESTAHIDEAGKVLWDASFGKPDMGCPFAIAHRTPIIREQVEFFADAYRRAELPVDFVFADWEIDGPIEWNGAWAVSKQCKRCRENIPGIENFLEFQNVLRSIRSDLQRSAYAEVILERFPKAIVGNYGVYPHDGLRYWYDYFEKESADWPGITDQRARYRHWANEFEGTGYTFAMPVVYPWPNIFGWYDFDVADYRWLYNMLLVATNGCANTPRGVPIISFVHFHTIPAGEQPDPAIKQMSERAYQELLWHMLLRGTDTFFLWCMPKENRKEVELLHQVWAAAQEYGEFLDNGTPISFDVPKQPGTVVSGLQLGNRVLVRRTDFTSNSDEVRLRVGSWMLRVPPPVSAWPSPGTCRVLTLEQK